jgi:hypothetical protein
MLSEVLIDPETTRRLEDLRLGLLELVALGRSAAVDQSISNEFGCEVDRPINAALSEPDIAALEHEYELDLPLEYRSYLARVGDGGLGPAGHLFRARDALSSAHAPARPFTGSPSTHLLGHRVGDAERSWGENRDGTMPLADYGCGMTGVLVLQGPHRGEIWMDDPNADTRGPHPWEFYAMLHGRIDDIDDGLDRPFEGRHYSFLSWVEEWVQAVLPAARSAAVGGSSP